MLGTIEAVRAYGTVHPGAIYLHLGRSYHVVDLDLAARRAVLEPFSGDYFTQTKRETMTYIERLHEQRTTHGVTLSYGSVVYSETVVGFQRKHLQDHTVIDFNGLELPTVEFETRALWYELDELIAGEPFPPEHLLGALHALEHGQIAVLPLIAMCDRWDIGGLSTNAHPQTGGPTIFIYDGHPGGVGITRRGYDGFDAARRRRPAADRRMPVQGRVPIVRAVAEVRQPQRAAVQARRARTARTDDGYRTPSVAFPVTPVRGWPRLEPVRSVELAEDRPRDLRGRGRRMECERDQLGQADPERDRALSAGRGRRRCGGERLQPRERSPCRRRAGCRRAPTGSALCGGAVPPAAGDALERVRLEHAAQRSRAC